MKKLLGIAFVGMMAFGCGSGTKSTPEGTTPATTQPATGDPNATPPPAGDATQTPPAGGATQTPSN